MKKPLTLKRYDVLQISRDHGKTWLDFSTLRDESDFAFAVRYVRNPQAWASQEEANAAGYRFRVSRMGTGVVLTDEPDSVDEPDGADDLTPELDDWASNQDEPEVRDFYSYGRGS